MVTLFLLCTACALIFKAGNSPAPAASGEER
jgi:hypothetical protein